MAHYKVAVENGNNIFVTVDPSVSNVNVVLDRGVSGVGIDNIETVFISPDYFLKFYYTNGTTENVLLPATEATVLSFNTRIGVVTLNSADVTTALGYTPPTPTGTGATGTWGISVSGNAGTVTNGVYTTDTSTVTNTMLAGSIANNKLTNSAITINDTSTSLGGTVNVGTVTSVSGAGTVNGINLSGAVTTSGNLTLSGALTGVDLTSQVTGTLPVSNGGTSASNATNARTNLGLGTIATQNANSVAITGGTITGITLAVANGGTGASTLTGYVKGSGAAALSASTTIPSTDITGLGTIATQNANAAAITGGSVNGTTVGATTASTGAFTNFVASGTATFTSNEAVKIPVGSTAQRPTPSAGMLRFNSTSGEFEGYSTAWASVFGRSNILGTVSQTAGVPTGAIIERGSNGNGDFVRFADGTQICTRALGGVRTIAAGDVLNLGTFNYAASFSNLPIVVITISGSFPYDFICNAETGVDASSFAASAKNIGGNLVTDINFAASATGRWF